MLYFEDVRTIARASVPLISHQMARKGKFSVSEVKMKEEAVIFLLFGYIILGFTGGSAGKESVCNAGNLGLIPVIGKIPWRRKWQPTPIFLPGESHGQRNLVGYSSWGRKRVRHD